MASEGLIDNLVGFKIGNEIISSHMPLLIEIGKVIVRNGNTEFTDKQVTHEVVKYIWDERVNEEFLDIMNSNVNEICMQGIKYFLQKDQINEAYNLLFSVRRAGAIMRCDRRMVSRKEHWFDEECGEKRRQTSVALRKCKEKDDVSRMEYRAKRKEYERLIGGKRGTWQEEAEYINTLVHGKDIKKIWKAVRKKKNPQLM
jgi:hypothetical protein